MTPPSELNRRRLLLGAAAAGAAATVGAVAALGGGAVEGTGTAAAQQGPLGRTERGSGRKGSLSDIEHVVVLMQENRSFDHYYGSMRGVRGFSDQARLAGVFRQPNPAGGTLLPFHVDSYKVDGQQLDDLAHAWSDQHQAWNNGLNNGWIGAKGPKTMAYFDRDDVPFHYALADAFTLCDQYHCSLMSSTTPNRLYLFTGKIDETVPGATGNPPDYRPVYSWKTYPERLQEAGVSWQVYANKEVGDSNATGTDQGYLGDYGDNPLWLFHAYHDALDSPDPKVRQLAERANVTRGWLPDSGKGRDVTHVLADWIADCRRGELPRVSWIVAPYRYCEHPVARPVDGANYVQTVLRALWANPDLWSRTAVFLNYDENDGYFDHVLAPVPAPGTPHEWVSGALSGTGTDQPIGLGARVPMTVISPWTRGGWVNSQVFDHTSVIRFLERWTGVHEPNISDWRRAVSGDLLSCFDFDSYDDSVPRLPDTTKLRAEMDRLEPGLPPVTVPPAGSIRFPHQEPGTRPARPLPYQLLSNAAITGNHISVRMDNRGAATASFSVFNGGQPPSQHLVHPGAADSVSAPITALTADAAVNGTQLAAAVPLPQAAAPVAGAVARTGDGLASASGGLLDGLGSGGAAPRQNRAELGMGGAGLVSGGHGVAGVPQAPLGEVPGLAPFPGGGVGSPVPAAAGGGVGASDGYRVTVIGPNGFLREFAGGPETPVESTVTLGGDRDDPALRLRIANHGRDTVRATVTDRLDDDRARTVSISPGATHEEDRDPVSDARGWYDFRVTLDRDPRYAWRYAGHLENGRPSESLPTE
jgi:phospholipase C